MARGNKETAQLHRAWLRELPKILGASLSKIADGANVARTTLTDPVSASDDGTSTLSAKTIEKIVKKYGVQPPSFMPSGAPLRAIVEEAARYDWKPGNPLNDAIKVLISGRGGADPWTIRNRALDVLGYMPGDIVIVDLDRTPQVGDIVCAQVNADLNRGAADTVMRVYQRAGSAFVLMTASSDPALQQPIAVDDRVEVKGVVTDMLRPVATPRAA